MKISYFYPAPANAELKDGEDILHQKLMAELSRHSEVDTIAITRGPRTRRLPLWAEKISPEVQEDLRKRCRAGDVIVLSHERLFDMAKLTAKNGQVAHLIVQNYMPRFRFPGRLFVSLAYSLGARAFFKKAFEQSGSILFLGANDQHAAEKDQRSEVVSKFGLAQIPPAPLGVDYRFDPTLLHFSGSGEWLPKRLSKLSVDETVQLEQRFTLADYFDQVQSGFTLIEDRFDIGFKLKLMQALSMGDFIFSRIDLRREIDAICPEYRWYRTVDKVADVITWGQDAEILKDVDSADRERCARQICEAHTWEEFGNKLTAILSG